MTRLTIELEMRSIVLVEDNPADVYLIREALSANSVEADLKVLGDGEAAIKYVDSLTSPAVTPDLMVLDLNLPKTDGMDILKHIRANPVLSDTPVVILTSSDSPKDRRATLRLGATMFITKPSDLDAFLGLGKVFSDVIDGKRSTMTIK